MAMPPPKPPNLYNVLGVSENATEDELRRARNRMAKQIHPDKNMALEDIATKHMQKVNEAYRVLSDRVQRRDYDMQLQEDGAAPSGDSIPLPDGRKFSECLLTEFYSWTLTDIKTVDDIGQSRFLEKLQNSLNEFLDERFQELDSNCSTAEHSTQMKHQTTPSLSDQILRSGLTKPHTAVHAKHAYGVYRRNYRADTEKLQTVQKVLNVARTKKNKVLPNVLREGESVPIVDFSHSEMCYEDLRVVSSLFGVHAYHTYSYSRSGEPNASSKRELLRQLSQFIPVVKVSDPPPSQPWWRTTNANACTACLCELPQGVESHLLRLPRRGLWKPQKVCEECCNRNYEEDMQDWVQAGLRFLDKCNQHAAMGCFYMAECSRAPGISPLLDQAKAAMQRGSPEAALPLLFDVVEKSNDPKEKVRAHLRASSALQDWAGQPNTPWYESWLLLLAAHSAIVMAKEDACQTSNAFANEEIQAKLKMIDSEIYSLEKQKGQEVDNKVKQISQALDQAWTSRNWEAALEMVTAETDQKLQNITGGRNYLVEAIEDFLKGKEAYLDRMLLEDRAAVHFMQGVLKIVQGQVRAGLADIQMAAWNGLIVCWIPFAAAHQVLNLLPQQLEFVLPIRALLGVVKGIASGAAALSDLDEMFPVLSKHFDVMTNKLQWPDLKLVSYNTNSLHKYEQGVKKQVKEGKWTEYEAALAYLDLIPACSHTAEVAVCFLTASAWFLKALQCKLKKVLPSKNSEQSLYALKNAVFWCLDKAVAIAHLSLHPGMKLYVSRLCIGTALRVSQLAHTLVREVEGKKIAHWIEVFTYNCRQCPFWQAPIVMVCEAVLLNIISGRLHSEFVAGMLHLEPKYRPISLSELHYQLYENDLKTLYPLESASARCRAMMELLKDNGWHIYDVANLLSSFLSPRSAEGWLTANPEFRVPLEYAAVNGIVVKINQEWPGSRSRTATIELIVEPADVASGKPGLFSQNDINTVLQLDPQEAPFFSLDPPSINQCFHPFQEFRYLPSQLNGTKFLQTLFETDYLLKSFSIGSDISSKPPFNQRPCSEGLTANLPPGLQAALKPVSERGYRCSHVNRFWIQADEIMFECDQSGPQIKISVRQMVNQLTKRIVSENYYCEISDTQIEFRFGVPKMSVRAHPLLPGADGKLEDSSTDLDPDSAEAKFARDLTANYDRLSHYFPVFARLRELAKLSMIPKLLRSVESSLEKEAEATECNAVILKDIPRVHCEKIETKIKDSAQHNFAAFKSCLDTLLSAAAKSAASKHKDKPCIWVPAAVHKVESEETMELAYGGVILAPMMKAGAVPKQEGSISVLLADAHNRSSYSSQYSASCHLATNGREYRGSDRVSNTLAGCRSRKPGAFGDESSGGWSGADRFGAPTTIFGGNWESREASSSGGLRAHGSHRGWPWEGRESGGPANLSSWYRGASSSRGGTSTGRGSSGGGAVPMAQAGCSSNGAGSFGGGTHRGGGSSRGGGSRGGGSTGDGAVPTTLASCSSTTGTGSSGGGTRGSGGRADTTGGGTQGGGTVPMTLAACSRGGSGGGTQGGGTVPTTLAACSSSGGGSGGGTQGGGTVPTTLAACSSSGGGSGGGTQGGGTVPTTLAACSSSGGGSGGGTQGGGTVPTTLAACSSSGGGSGGGTQGGGTVPTTLAACSSSGGGSGGGTQGGGTVPTSLAACSSSGGGSGGGTQGGGTVPTTLAACSSSGGGSGGGTQGGGTVPTTLAACSSSGGGSGGGTQGGGTVPTTLAACSSSGGGSGGGTQGGGTVPTTLAACSSSGGGSGGGTQGGGTVPTTLAACSSSGTSTGSAGGGSRGRGRGKAGSKHAASSGQGRSQGGGRNSTGGEGTSSDGRPQGSGRSKTGRGRTSSRGRSHGGGNSGAGSGHTSSGCKSQGAGRSSEGGERISGAKSQRSEQNGEGVGGSSLGCEFLRGTFNSEGGERTPTGSRLHGSKAKEWASGDADTAKGTQEASRGRSGGGRPAKLKLNHTYQAPGSLVEDLASALARMMAAKKTALGCQSYEIFTPVHPNALKQGYLIFQSRQLGTIQLSFYQNGTNRYSPQTGFFCYLLDTALPTSQSHLLKSPCKACFCKQTTEVPCYGMGEYFPMKRMCWRHKEEGIVYLARCSYSGLQYVGSTTGREMKDAVHLHRSDENSPLYQHWKSPAVPADKEFHEVFDFEVLEYVDNIDKLKQRKEFYMDHYETQRKGLNKAAADQTFSTQPKHSYSCRY